MTRIGTLMGVSRVLSMVLAAAMLFVACGPSNPQARNPTTVAPRTDRDRQPQTELADEKEPPIGRLPRDVEPQEYTLALQIVPSEDRFSGSARIDVTLDKPRSVIWMHGRKLDVTEATVTPEGGEPVEATWEQADKEAGVAALRVPEPLAPGRATIAITYSAPFDRKLKGLYRVDTGGESYAFTQFEATSARQAFPGFDEPSFKTPFDVTLIVEEDDVAAANTPVVDEKEVDGGLKRIHYAKTKPLPTYLIAFAVGPLDVVEADAIPANDHRDEALPFRGLAVKGKGEQLKYALENTPGLLKSLETYFAGPHPFAKLDIVAVPDFAAGAMENVGLVTFRETLLLVDDNAPVWQKRAFAGVMAHELAHMWFGNLVTMPWWNDIWLNEAFATWLASKTVADVFPEYNADLHQLESVQRAMRQDSLMSARKIRQPIESNHDIRNAFDSITYRKGGGVLAMFEKWMGEETFRKGMRTYMREHAWGNATAEDLVEQLSAAAEKDVATPFNTFLTQPGLPFVKVEPRCEEGSASLGLSQSRYLPVGSEGDAGQSWKFPMCVKYSVDGETKEQCTMLAEAEAMMELEGEGCPDWVLPNAAGAGYFRFSMPSESFEALRTEGWDELTPRDKLAVADSLRASFNNASMETEATFASLEPLAESEIRPVLEIPKELLGFAHDYLVDEDGQTEVERMGRNLFRSQLRELGWGPRRGREEDGETKMRRATVLGFLALSMEDERVRREAAKRGREYVGYKNDGEVHADVVDSNLVDIVLAVAVQESDEAYFTHLEKMLFASEDSLLRGRLLRALGHARDPELAERARALALDERVRVNEATTPLRVQTRMPETRDGTWRWLTENFDALKKRISSFGAGYTPYMASNFCSEDKAEAVQSFFADRIEALPGGPRNLRASLESIRLCAARVDAHEW